MRTLLLLVACFCFSNTLVFAQCTNGCTKGKGSSPLVSYTTIKKINRGDIESLKGEYEILNGIYLNGDGEKYFDKLYPGVGCYFYYYAYVKLTVESKKNPDFIDFLATKGVNNLAFTKKNALLALSYIAEITYAYENPSCENLHKEIFGNKGADKLVYQEDLRRLALELKSTSIDLAIEDFPIWVRDGEIFGQVTVSNQSSNDHEAPITIAWTPDQAMNQQKSITIPSLAAGKTETVSLTGGVLKSIPFTSTIKVGSEMMDSNPENNEGDYYFNTPIHPDTDQRRLTINSNENKISSAGLTPDPGEENCFELDHYFEPGVMEHANSNRLNEIVFRDVLKRHFNTALLQTEGARIQVIGYADGLPIGNKILNEYGFINASPYYSMDRCDQYGNATLSRINFQPYQKVKTNQELAFLRAYSLKSQIVDYLGIEENLITIYTDTTQVVNNGNLRKGQVIICSSSFTIEILKQIENEIIYRKDNAKPYASKPEVSREDDQQKFQLEKVEIGDVVAIEDLLFEADSSTLVPQHYPILNNFSASLAAHPTIRIEVGGHTNTICRDRCVELSLRRAKAVRDYLLGKGIALNRMEIRGYGNTSPIKENNESEVAIIQNQRVEIKFLSQ